MRRVPLSDGWTYQPMRGAFEHPDSADQPQRVFVPHDAIRDRERSADSAQGVHTGYFPGGAFRYTYELDVPEEWRDSAAVIEFEGVYRDAVVYLNGNFLGHEPNGYTEFTVALDDFLQYGEKNLLTVEARAHQDSRWYSGAGLYRPVNLAVGGLIHLPLDSTAITTTDVGTNSAVMVVETTVVNGTRQASRTRIEWSVIDPQGHVVARDSAPVTVGAHASAVARTRISLDSPFLWSLDSPALYRVIMRLLAANGDELDGDEVTCGIRTVQVDPSRGLRLNGEPILLRGACVHHDNGPLGAATHAAAEERRVRLLHEAGFNALRSAHNPMSRAMLDACDRYGVLVMDELTDTWTRAKTAFDGSMTFLSRAQNDLRSLVTKDRNHPSVIMYSIGNEILELGSPVGSMTSRRLAETVRKLDDTRFVTNGINGIIANLDNSREEVEHGDRIDPNTMMATMGQRMSAVNSSPGVTDVIDEAASVLDIVGLNYADSRYESDAALFPHRVIVGSETFPSRIDVMWSLVKRLPHVIGDFTWTGWDYLGEAGAGRVDYTDEPGYTATGIPGPYPSLTAECGDLDITGHRRTISYWREIVYGLRSDPYIAVHRPQHYGRPTASSPWAWDDSVASWSWGVEEGRPVIIDVYADADDVELLLDGESLAIAPVGEPRSFTARFETTYRRGELSAVARRAGVEIGRTTLRTAEDPLVLHAEPETTVIGEDGLAYIRIALADESGVVATDRDSTVTVRVEGPGVLAAVGTGRSRTEERFGDTAVTTYDGRALVIVRPIGRGSITVVIEAPGYATATAVVQVRD